MKKDLKKILFVSRRDFVRDIIAKMDKTSLNPRSERTLYKCLNPKHPESRFNSNEIPFVKSVLFSLIENLVYIYSSIISKKEKETFKRKIDFLIEKGA